MSTQFPSKPAIERRWHVIDANGVVLGKLASDAAKILMGKTKASWTPFLDTGDHVIVINADKVVLTGKKEDQKLYRHFTGYPGGLVETKATKVRAERPVPAVEILDRRILRAGADRHRHVDIGRILDPPAAADIAARALRDDRTVGGIA